MFYLLGPSQIKHLQVNHHFLWAYFCLKPQGSTHCLFEVQKNFQMIVYTIPQSHFLSEGTTGSIGYRFSPQSIDSHRNHMPRYSMVPEDLPTFTPKMAQFYGISHNKSWSLITYGMGYLHINYTTLKMAQMQVDMPYMQHLRYYLSIYIYIYIQIHISEYICISILEDTYKMEVF